MPFDIKTLKSYFFFSNRQRKGILLLLLLIVVLQVAWFCYAELTVQKEEMQTTTEMQWISLQSELDSIKQEKQDYVAKIHPFNPNFITDYKGYKLGMSVAEIDRLHAFRKTNQYVNSAKEFQIVTKISDSLLNTMAPYFKFPDWVNRKKEVKSFANYSNSAYAKKEKITVKDINQATQEDLIKISGIGEAISLRILKYKESLGGFVSMEQMQEVWGLSPEVIEQLNKYFKITTVPNVKKIDINNASIKEIAQLPYFNYQTAKKIVTFRSMNGDFQNIQDLTKIKGLSIDNPNIIALYLTF